MDLSFVKSIIFLMDLFNKNKVKHYFVDDHILGRIFKLKKIDKYIVIQYASELKLNSIL